MVDSAFQKRISLLRLPADTQIALYVEPRGDIDPVLVIDPALSLRLATQLSRSEHRSIDKCHHMEMKKTSGSTYADVCI